MSRSKELMLFDLSTLLKKGGLGRELALATFRTMTLRVLGLAMTFVVGVQLARYLGPEQLGFYGVVIAISVLLAVPVQLGLPQLVTRELSVAFARQSYAAMRGIIIWSTTAVFVASIIIVILSAIAITWLPLVSSSVTRTAFYWGFAIVPLTALIALGVGVLRGFGRIAVPQAYENLLRPALVAVLLLSAVFWYAPLNAQTAIILQFISSGIVLAAIFSHIALAVPATVRQTSYAPIGRTWAKSAVPMCGTEVLRIADGQYPLLLLGFLTTFDQLGVLRVAISLVALVGLPATLLALVIMSLVARLHAAGSREALQRAAAMAALVIFSSALGITAILLLFGEFLLRTIFGAPFAAAWLPLVLMSFAYVINGYFGAVAMVLNMCGQERTVTRAYFAGLLVGMIFTAALHPFFGLAAVGLAMCCSEIVRGLWMFRVARTRIGIDPSVAGLFRFAHPALEQAVSPVPRS